MNWIWIIDYEGDILCLETGVILYTSDDDKLWYRAPGMNESQLISDENGAAALAQVKDALRERDILIELFSEVNDVGI